MREIKFRVWNTETNKMIINVKEMGVFALQSIYSIDEFLVIPTNEKYPLMQYTGLKDKNGVEIYEGDICKTERSAFKEDDNTLGIVEFHNGCFMRKIKYSKDKIGYHNLFNLHCKVVGNIYENPELLKEGN